MNRRSAAAASPPARITGRLGEHQPFLRSSPSKIRSCAPIRRRDPIGANRFANREQNIPVSACMWLRHNGVCSANVFAAQSVMSQKNRRALMSIMAEMTTDRGVGSCRHRGHRSSFLWGSAARRIVEPPDGER